MRFDIRVLICAMLFSGGSFASDLVKAGKSVSAFKTTASVMMNSEGQFLTGLYQQLRGLEGQKMTFQKGYFSSIKKHADRASLSVQKLETLSADILQNLDDDFTHKQDTENMLTELLSVSQQVADALENFYIQTSAYEGKLGYIPPGTFLNFAQWGSACLDYQKDFVEQLTIAESWIRNGIEPVIDPSKTQFRLQCQSDPTVKPVVEFEGEVSIASFPEMTGSLKASLAGVEWYLGGLPVLDLTSRESANEFSGSHFGGGITMDLPKGYDSKDQWQRVVKTKVDVKFSGRVDFGGGNRVTLSPKGTCVIEALP